jgi:hypothetical protein
VLLRYWNKFWHSKVNRFIKRLHILLSLWIRPWDESYCSNDGKPDDNERRKFLWNWIWPNHALIFSPNVSCLNPRMLRNRSDVGMGIDMQQNG